MLLVLILLSYLMIIGGVVFVAPAFSRGEKKNPALNPAPVFSRASKCVWKMDTEG